mgnify:CR=1 FL=1
MGKRRSKNLASQTRLLKRRRDDLRAEIREKMFELKELGQKLGSMRRNGRKGSRVRLDVVAAIPDLPADEKTERGGGVTVDAGGWSADERFYPDKVVVGSSS